jgi:hypothetical protein
MNTRVLQNLFKELKLNMCGQEVSNVLSNCNCRVETDWLVDLLTKEVDSRREKKLANRIR